MPAPPSRWTPTTPARCSTPPRPPAPPGWLHQAGTHLSAARPPEEWIPACAGMTIHLGRPLEIQIRVVLRRCSAGDVVGEDLPEAGARLDPRIPFLGRLVLVPGHVADIVEAGE